VSPVPARLLGVGEEMPHATEARVVILLECECIARPLIAHPLGDGGLALHCVVASKPALPQ